MLKRGKHFSQSVRPMVSVAVSKLVFVQPGAKIVFITATVRTYLNAVYYRQFAVSRTTTSCSSRTERHARHSPHCRLPAFQWAWVQWTRKLAAEQSRSKSRGLSSVDSVVADGVTSQTFKHWSVEANSDRLLGSAKPGHTEPSDWSAAKKTEDVYQGKGWSCWISSGLTICVRDRPWFTVCRIKTHASLSNSRQFWGYWRFMQIRQRIFNCTDIQITHFILDKILKLLTYNTPFYH